MASTKKRRLAAIMFADIVGYTAMMQKDEAKAAQLLDKFRETLTTCITSSGGQIIQFYGDGCLSIFDSSVDAVHCSLSVQKTFNTDLIVPVRIGLHSGDIFIQEDNIFGDSVNITSRVESMGIPGAVLLTKKLRDEIKNHVEFDLTSLGDFEFKNVEEPIEVFALANDGLTIPKTKELKGKFKSSSKNTFPSQFLKLAASFIAMIALLSAGYYFMNSSNHSTSNNTTTSSTEPITDSTKSLAIFPFDNINGTAEKDYLASGLSDEIRAHLSSFDNIKVISRSSSTFYKGENLPLPEVAKTLNISHVLTGQISWQDDKINVIVELNDAQKDEIEWSKSFEILTTAFSGLENKITQQLVTKLDLNLTAKQTTALASAKIVDPDIYDKWLKAWHDLNDYTPEKMLKAYQIAESIIAEDPNYASAYYILGYYHLIHAVWFGSEDTNADLEKAKELFNKGISIDPENALCYLGISNIKLFYEWDFEGAEIAVKNAEKLGAERAILVSIMTKFYNGEFEEASNRLAHHKEVDPLSVYHDFYKGRILFFQGKAERAKEVLRNGVRLYGLIDYYHSLGKVHLNTDDYFQAISTLEKGLEKVGKNHPPMMGDLGIAYAKNGDTEKSKQVLTTLENIFKTGGGGSPAFYSAQIYSGLGDTEKAFEWLDKSFNNQETEMVWLKIEPQFDNIRSDERFAELLTKVGFPQVLLN